jgi:hypothetical protein
MDQLLLVRREERLRDRIVTTDASPAEGTADIVHSTDINEFRRHVLRFTITRGRVLIDGSHTLEDTPELVAQLVDRRVCSEN